MTNQDDKLVIRAEDLNKYIIENGVVDDEIEGATDTGHFCGWVSRTTNLDGNASIQHTAHFISPMDRAEYDTEYFDREVIINNLVVVDEEGCELDQCDFERGLPSCTWPPPPESHTQI